MKTPNPIGNIFFGMITTALIVGFVIGFVVGVLIG